MVRKIHWRASGYSVPRARCGAWIGNATLTRDERKVTCRKCRNFLMQARLSLEAVRGRLIAIEDRDGETQCGTLMEAVSAGLQLGRDDGGKPRLIRWSRIKRFAYLDRDADSAESPKDEAGQG